VPGFSLIEHLEHSCRTFVDARCPMLHSAAGADTASTEAQAESAAFLTCFDALVAARQPGKVFFYPLGEVLPPSLPASPGAAQTFVDIALFGVKKRGIVNQVLIKYLEADVDWLLIMVYHGAS